jgi:hypothetical protein
MTRLLYAYSQLNLCRVGESISGKRPISRLVAFAAMPDYRIRLEAIEFLFQSIVF